MVEYQLPLSFLSAYLDLTDKDNELVRYFRSINIENIRPVVKTAYLGPGPTGYETPLILSRILKVKQVFISDRVLTKRLKENATYRILCGFTLNKTPAHTTYNTLRRKLKAEGFAQIHEKFVREASNLGLLTPEIPRLPKRMRKGVILVGDSTPIRAYCSSKGEKLPDGTWLFTDPSVAFGKPHHRDKYPVGHKAHSLISVTGIPMVSIVSPRNKSDKDCIFPLLEVYEQRFADIPVAYLVLDRGYDGEEIHRGVYERYGIIPVIIRKKMTYPKGFKKDGTPLCRYGLPMTKIGIDYRRKRTKYACRKKCQRAKQYFLPCHYLDSENDNGLIAYTRFKDSYRKYGPVLPGTVIYKKLRPLRTAIERNYGLVKENRYRMEYTNTYMGIENVTIHVIEHDMVLTQDILFDYRQRGKISPLIKL